MIGFFQGFKYSCFKYNRTVKSHVLILGTIFFRWKSWKCKAKSEIFFQKGQFINFLLQIVKLQVPDIQAVGRAGRGGAGQGMCLPTTIDWPPGSPFVVNIQILLNWFFRFFGIIPLVISCCFKLILEPEMFADAQININVFVYRMLYTGKI